MALDSIWKLQLTLVSYGNAYLSDQCQLDTLRLHQAFDLHEISWRDLTTQQLLAQHYTVWLERLKQLQVTHISLHHASLLSQEKNPNPHVELLAISHFIVSHHGKQKFAWIFGHELAQWYLSNESFQYPSNQQSSLRQMTYWRFELNNKLSKMIDQDLKKPNWDEIQLYLDDTLFKPATALSLHTEEIIQDHHSTTPYTGQKQDDPDQLQVHALIPSQFQCPYIHHSLFRFDALDRAIQEAMRQSSDQDAPNAQHLAQLRAMHIKLDEHHAKFIVKAANHFQSAQVSPIVAPSPFDTPMITDNRTTTATAKNNKVSVLTLIIITAALCVAAYYFGL